MKPEPELMAGTPVVIYAAKSTEDKHGSIGTQLEDCRTMAEREGWTVIGEFTDEAFSAYSGNRGPGLAQARQMAAEHAPAVLGRPALRPVSSWRWRRSRRG